MPSYNTRLPVEIFFQIILSSNFRLADLVVFSRVCHSWYRVLFPLLYDTVYLSWDAPVFAARILYEHIVQHTRLPALLEPSRLRSSSPIDGLCVTDYVKRLVLDNRVQRQHPSFHPLESAIISAALPKLTKLKSVDWTLPWLPDNTNIFRALSQCCPGIEDFSFDIPMNISRYDDNQFADMFSFRNLKRIRIKDFGLAHSPNTHGHIPPSLIEMIISSPGIEHLELDLKEDPKNEEYDESGWLVEAIAPVLERTFPRLTIFSLKGTANIDSEFFVQANEQSDLREFLFRHPSLRGLELPWDWEMNALIHQPLQLGVPALRGVLPHLRHFIGPTYLVMLFLQLGFAQKLERLGIRDSADDEDTDLSGFSQSFHRLPNLERLDFLSTYMLDCTTFSEVLRATPNLVELTLLWVDGDPESAKTALVSLPKLKYLNLGFNVLPHLANRKYKYISKERESQEVFELARQCTSLVLLRIYPEEDIPDTFDYQTCWHIQRHSTEVVDITFSGLRKRQDVGSSIMLDAGYYHQLYNEFAGLHWGFTPTIQAQPL